MVRPGRAARLGAALGTVGFALCGARYAGATYSVVAVDTATRQVGGAGTSCLQTFDVYMIYGSVPGQGVVHAQALFSQLSRDHAVELLAGGAAPADIIAAITSPSYDASAGLRQFAVADLAGRVAAHTGSQAQAYAGHRRGMLGSFSYSVQGNILTGEAVLTQAATAFESGGCDLAERLLRALEGGALGGQGDSRCTPDGIPSNSAFVQVDREGEPSGRYVSLRVPNSGASNPLAELRASFDTWRETHPCPDSSAGAAGAAGAVGVAGAGVAGGGSGGESGGSALPPEAPAENAGCGCRTTRPPRTSLFATWGLLMLGLAMRRSVRRSANDAGDGSRRQRAPFGAADFGETWHQPSAPKRALIRSVRGSAALPTSAKP